MTQTKKNEKAATGKAAGGNRQKQAAAQAAPAEATENPQTSDNTAQTGPEIQETAKPTEASAPETVADSPQAPKPAKPAGGEKKKEADRLPAFLAPYVKAYPTNKTFHVTTDKMVFLANDRGLAVMHQNSLKKGGAVETYNL